MKYLIKNVSRDPKYAIRRRAHPLHVTRAPFICGKRLYPRGHMPVESSILTAKDREHIDNLIKAGIIEVSIAGGASCIQRVTLAPKTVKPLVEKKVDTVEKPKEKPKVCGDIGDVETAPAGGVLGDVLTDELGAFGREGGAEWDDNALFRFEGKIGDSLE